MEPEQLEAIWELTRSALVGMVETSTNLLEACRLLRDENAAMRLELSKHAEHLALLHAQTIIRDDALAERLDGLDDRVSSVHKAALRALNLTTGGTPAA